MPRFFNKLSTYGSPVGMCLILEILFQLRISFK